MKRICVQTLASKICSHTLTYSTGGSHQKPNKCKNNKKFMEDFIFNFSARLIQH
ncbi:hypothetical protein LGK95_12625 [Clostridium algoriphilum]|uniref:hypothetical protein n=1 Tax=Clostridium algoriphilum TaxID=198347 RepID=UPI001CF4A9F6|nr:hypothetical protein [Clostridium algoriphilum]MCB2294353.1 hypothetical protein [Clostridium algoriphilum]